MACNNQENAAEASGRTWCVSVARMSGEVLGQISLPRNVTTVDALQKIRKLGTATMGEHYLPLVVIGTKILPDDCETRLRDHLATQSAEISAILVPTESRQIRAVNMEGQLLQTFNMPGSNTMKDVALAFENAEGIPAMRQQIFVDKEVVLPHVPIASFKHHPLTISMNVLPETDVIRMVSISGDPNTQSQFVIDGVTKGDPSKYLSPYNVKAGSHMMLKGSPCPCKVLDVATSKPGKNSWPKLYIRACSVFTDAIYEQMIRPGEKFDMPVVCCKRY